MYKPSNPAPLYPAVGWVGNLLPLSFLFAFNLCVLPRAPPACESACRCRQPTNLANVRQISTQKLKRPPGVCITKRARRRSCSHKIPLRKG